jgi:GT2 family glycosyltransferase
VIVVMEEVRMRGEEKPLGNRSLDGLSVIICCHNGASRLAPTFAHLRAQEPPGVQWEVLLIDNASTDGTVAAARSYWKDGPAPLRVVAESRLGTRYARERGFLEASYSFIGFVDDDNWVARNWVRAAYEVMSSDPRLGAVSSIRIPACEVPLPCWFDRYHGPYAILTQQEFERMHEPPLYLPTAGLCVRTEAWNELVENGFQWIVRGRVGQDLAGGEDTELTTALRFDGWKLKIDPRLQLQHFLPPQRLQWVYLRRMVRSNEASTVLLDGYTDHSLSLRSGPRCRVSDWWCYQFGHVLAQLARHPRAILAAFSSAAEGRHDVMQAEKIWGRAIGLLRFRGRYGAVRRMVRTVPWKRLPRSSTSPRSTYRATLDLKPQA